MYQVDLNAVALYRARTGKSLKALGIDPNTLTRARKGRPLRAETVKKLADALCCDVADILKGGDDFDS